MEAAGCEVAGGAAAKRATQKVYAQGSSHPVETIQKDWLRNQLENKHYVMGNVYGTHLPLRLKMEMNILSQVARLPGIRSSHSGLNTILGRDETIDFEDYLGVPENSEHDVDTRAMLERKYGITAPTSLLGPAAVGGMPQKAAHLDMPRAGVALAKNLC